MGAISEESEGVDFVSEKGENGCYLFDLFHVRLMRENQIILFFPFVEDFIEPIC